MKEVEPYIFGRSKIPPWVGDKISNVRTDLKGKIVGASLLTDKGMKEIYDGDVLMKVNGKIIVLKEDDAIKYGVFR